MEAEKGKKRLLQKPDPHRSYQLLVCDGAVERVGEHMLDGMSGGSRGEE